MKLLVGLARLPRTVSLDDPRLPWIVLTSEPLRLNTHPVPAVLLAETPPDHDSRVAALTRWLQSQADPWSATIRRDIADYMAGLARAVTQPGLEHRLARYDGLFRAEDHLWSALRPLPRAWLLEPGAAPVFAELAFWNGRSLDPTPPDTPIDPAIDELPVSPFRRPDQSVISIT